MEFKSFFILITLVFLFSSCSKGDDERIPIDDQEITIVPFKITFVHEDGTAIAADECINPTSNYALLISTKYEGNLASEEIKPTPVKYTLNGTQYVATFLKDGDQVLNKAKLINGNNTAEIAETTLKTQLYLLAPDDFVFVE
jgi:hypothetical protein